MMSFLSHKRLSTAVLLYLLGALIAPVSAQNSVMVNQNAATETLSLTVGDILEILPASDVVAPTYSWILTQDRTFMQAGRSPSFRYRFIQPGMYSLIAEIHAADQSTTISRIFTINAKARTPGDTGTVPSVTASGGVQTDALVTTDPAVDSAAHVILGNNQQLVKLIPQNPDVRPLALDINTAKDSDNDGNPANDVDNIGSFFQLYADPLYVWFASPLQSTSMAVTTIGANGAPRTQQIAVESLAYAQSQGTIVSPISIGMQPAGNGIYNFSAQTSDGSVSTTPFLYHWNFGDGQESLIMSPSHTYAADGTYTVTLQVRNLIDGKDVANEQQIVQVVGITAVASSASSTTSSVASSNGTTGGFPLMTILIGVGIFILFVLVGIGVVFLISRLRGGKSLDQTFADMEKTIVPKEDSTKNPPTLTIPATAVTAKVTTPAPTKEEVSRREENAASSPRPAATPRIDEKAAPDWLKKGLDTSPKTPSAPTPVPTPTAPTPAPSAPAAPAAPVIDPILKTVPPTVPTPVPPWLQSNPPTAPIATKPAPVPPKTPAPTQPAPTPPAAPAAMPQTPAPSWLQQAASTPSATVAPTPAPKPQAPVTAPTPAPVPAPKPAAPAIPPQPQAPVVAPTPVPTPTPTTPPIPAPVVPPAANPPKPVMPPAPVMPKPVIPPTPTPQPAPAAPVMMPTPVPKPTVAPTPVAPVQASTVTAPKPMAPVQAPTPNPAPQAPAPKPAPAPSAVPAAPTKPPLPTVQTPAPVAPKPQPTPTPVPAAPKPQPAPAPTPKPSIPEIQEMEQTDLPIAIIRADSLDQKKNDEQAAEPS